MTLYCLSIPDPVKQKLRPFMKSATSIKFYGSINSLPKVMLLKDRLVIWVNNLNEVNAAIENISRHATIFPGTEALVIVEGLNPEFDEVRLPDTNLKVLVVSAQAL